MIDNNSDSLPRSASQTTDDEVPQSDQLAKAQQAYIGRQASLHPSNSSSSSLTSGVGQSDRSSGNDQLPFNAADSESDLDTSTCNMPSALATVDVLKQIDPKLKDDIRKFVDDIFTDSQSISLRKKAEFGQLVRSPEARLLFAMYVDDYRVNSKRVSELTFYSLAQYFSIVLFECLVAEDFRPAKIIMNMMFTYYYEPKCDTKRTILSADNELVEIDHSNISTTSNNKMYLYSLLKDQEIFKSIRFWTSAFYESVIIERNNHPVFIDRGQGKLSNEKRIEESDCSKNITFGLLGSFIHNMSLLDLSHEFCQEFLNKHSTIAGLSDEHLELLRSNMKNLFHEDTAHKTATSGSERLASFIQKLSTKLNHSSTATPPT